MQTCTSSYSYRVITNLLQKYSLTYISKQQLVATKLQLTIIPHLKLKYATD